MESIFLNLYEFFKKRKPLFWSVLAGTLLLLGGVASRIELEEDISKFLPNDERVQKVNYIFQNSKFAERLVVMVSIKDSTSRPEPDSLVTFAEELIGDMQSNLQPYIKQIDSEVDDAKILEVVEVIQEHLPVFLDERDYKVLDSLTRPEITRRVMENNYRQLISPAGVAVKKIILKDPLGISFLALKKLQQLQYDENFELYQGYILTRDHRHLIFFLQPRFPANETKQNAKFLSALDEIMAATAQKHQVVEASYFGALAVAVGNARQLRQDTILTVSVMVVLLAVFLIGFFKRKRVLVLILLPVVFGGLFSLCCIYFIQGAVSVLALAVGAVVLGVAVNYAIHYLVSLRHLQSVSLVIKDLAKPLTIGSTTTVLAFFCLQFTNAAVLRDIGLFAGFSLIGAAVFSLVFLPHLVNERMIAHEDGKPNWIERFSFTALDSKKIFVVAILVLTPVFFYFAGAVTFNSDMSKLNFMNPETREAQQRLETINKASLNAIYVTASDTTLEGALQKNERSIPSLEKLKTEKKINKFTSVSSFLVSDSLQRERLRRWNAFWTTQRRKDILATVVEEGTKLKFSEKVFANADTLLSREYAVIADSSRSLIRDTFFDDYIIEKDGQATVITLANVPPADKEYVYKQLSVLPVQALDRQMLTNAFVDYIHVDFNFIVTFTSLMVFMSLLVLYGRIEITVITFVPMLFTWIWILGIMGLVGIEFNIVNVMVSTFIFGLGDDYSIFTMDGLQQEYRNGRKTLPSIRISIFLSAVTTISGLGVLIFAQHPALRSIAAISIIGIACVFIMALTIEPFLFRVLISNRTLRGLPPMSFFGILKTVFTYGFFVVGSLLLTGIGLLLKLIPVGKRGIKLFYHTLISLFTKALIYLSANLKKKIIGRTAHTFDRPSVIIANHASFLDILLLAMQHPKLILLTNKWVWNSPVFGGVVRLADYYPVMEGAEESVDRMRDRVAEGYSIVVFPEGTRSRDGSIGRFHKGAFYLAEALNVPILPLLIHGANDGISKGDMYLNDSYISMKFLPPIAPEDKRYGESYSERTKLISRYFKDEHQKLSASENIPGHYVYKMMRNYLYKGPVLEWYLRVKLKLEKNYEPFHNLVPMKASILDLGCGYGFLCYMLQFLSKDRTITGVDYDEDKIEVAQHGYLRTEQLQFHCADVTSFPMVKYDIIIISDVLHYFDSFLQEALLRRCFDALNPGGKVIIREGNAELRKRHKWTEMTELFSVKLLKFNKATQALNFVSGETLLKVAYKHGLEVSIQDDTKYTSNVIFVISKGSHVV